MDRYIEIGIRTDPEFPVHMLMSALMSKLHRALVRLEANDIGISFPATQVAPRTMGTKIRLHGTDGRLGALMETNWFKGMVDHLECSDLLIVPETAQHQVVRRRQVKSNVERLRRRRMKRKGESYEQVVQAIPSSLEKQSRLPFITLNSQSTGEVFKLFIEQSEVGPTAIAGSFNTYGLSQQATVPWF